MPMTRAALVATSVGLALGVELASSGPVRASGIGAPLIGTGWSGVATIDAAATYWNPALLGELSSVELQGTLSLLVAHVTYERERRAQYQMADGFRFKLPIEPADLDPAKTGWAPEVADVRVAPSGAFFAAIPLAKGLTLGAGAYAVQAALLDMPDNGPQRWAVQDATIAALQITPAIGWKITDWVEIGAGASAVIGFLELRQLFDLATSPLLSRALANDPINQPNDFGPDAPPGVRELDVLSRQATIRRATAIGWTFNAGAAFHPSEDTLISLAYQHWTKLTYEGEFYLDVNHPFFTEDLAAKGLAYPPRVKGTAFVELPIPASVRLGFAWQVTSAWLVQVHANWVWYRQVKALTVTARSKDLVQPELGLSDVTTLSLERDWNDTIEVETVAAWSPLPEWRFGVRLGYHSPASPDHTIDLTGIDGHRLLGLALLDYRLSDAFTLSAHAGAQGILSRSVTASDADRGNGRYSLLLANVGAALTWRL